MRGGPAPPPTVHCGACSAPASFDWPWERRGRGRQGPRGRRGREAAGRCAPRGSTAPPCPRARPRPLPSGSRGLREPWAARSLLGLLRAALPVSLEGRHCSSGCPCVGDDVAASPVGAYPLGRRCVRDLSHLSGCSL